MTSPLSGRTALVTGASRSIGRAVALRLARDGARVAVHYGSNDAAAEETLAAIRQAGGDAFALKAELTDGAAIEAAFAAFDRQAEGLDILVNNAGIADRGATAEMPEAAFDSTSSSTTPALPIAARRRRCRGPPSTGSSRSM
jgi:3-oxoacyl-[acyl-carrier protein] reductase